jgi:hypothetical protein
MLIDEREVETLFEKLCLLGWWLWLWFDVLEMLFLGEVIFDMERFRATLSADLLVCEGALWGILGASSSEVGTPK